ncbi:hypothetical protein BATDEDRAFT_26141 [Batrachochytrium dendrobatidis JAM81]|uniref:Uncharacterized protein n=2 Tax=Batrachochytrium dendrobatidis TaxID=109871 RepID=F4P6K8_BATDJ|nr:uncharacterized protein BATDEDRAFT_26141 [Batrachochytrium dendrobatidis JAM81]EGF78813.1 hypothetical protein BATDEDRAFT_26141 [Batrachochytrium dendrobatidis JAM81]KAK5667724.1 hypothetical protein QVD99_005832 [Batrachochytrium dendrobatidis]OAJ42431.1 hypothetical protein BDEG_25881 [Batrachochytrium dendrobatidis JEL423]OAJ45472.1 hypothetical protein BDEG_28611 [Batrachochytrium dendrobatidis JEL423]|eukprot:XP_006680321.1 hypothetical protein BATDEDRAFT_26141 [Batrachochytrium dendrobatidis JAM81]
MKLSIALLSSILAVCSVTTASPVYPSSATSSETSTPADGSDSPEYPTSADLKEYCGPFDDVEVSYIKDSGKTHAKIEKMFKKLELVSYYISFEKGLTTELQQKVETMKQTSDNGLSAAEAELKMHSGILVKLEAEKQERIDKGMSLVDEDELLMGQLKQYMGLDPSTNGDPTSPKTTSAYEKCHKFFLDSFMQALP